MQKRTLGKSGLKSPLSASAAWDESRLRPAIREGRMIRSIRTAP